jgi:transcription antitermination factor NusG
MATTAMTANIADISIVRVPVDQWYALLVKPQHEKKVAQALRHKEYPELLPLYRIKRRWANRTREVHLPLFPRYVFCRFNETFRLPILQIPSVQGIIKFGNRLAPVDEEEIESLRRIVSVGVPTSPHPYLQQGNTVYVSTGPLAGIRGILERFKGEDRLIVSVTLLQRSVSVEVDRTWVVPHPIWKRTGPPAMALLRDT